MRVCIAKGGALKLVAEGEVGTWEKQGWIRALDLPTSWLAEIRAAHPNEPWASALGLVKSARKATARKKASKNNSTARPSEKE